MKKFLTCSSHQIYKWRNRGGDEWSMQHAWEKRDFHTNSWSGNPGARECFEDHWEDKIKVVVTGVNGVCIGWIHMGENRDIC